MTVRLMEKYEFLILEIHTVTKVQRTFKYEKLFYIFNENKMYKRDSSLAIL